MPKKITKENAKEMGRKGGKNKKGYRSMKSVIDAAFEELTTTKDGKRITYLQAFINKAMHRAIIEGDIRAMEFLANRREGAPKATLDLSIKEPELPFYAGRSRKK